MTSTEVVVKGHLESKKLAKLWFGVQFTNKWASLKSKSVTNVKFKNPILYAVLYHFVQILLTISNIVVFSCEQIMTHSRGRMAKDNPIPEEADTGTAFTEEDFELFEENYAPS